MNTRKAKQIIADKLAELNIPYTKLTAKTVGFSDLARSSCIFVKIHGWKPNPAFSELKSLAVANGFRVETDW